MLTCVLRGSGQTFPASSFLNVQICSFSLSFLSVNEEFGLFGRYIIKTIIICSSTNYDYQQFIRRPSSWLIDSFVESQKAQRPIVKTVKVNVRTILVLFLHQSKPKDTKSTNIEDKNMSELVNKHPAAHERITSSSSTFIKQYTSLTGIN